MSPILCDSDICIICEFDISLINEYGTYYIDRLDIGEILGVLWNLNAQIYEPIQSHISQNAECDYTGTALGLVTYWAVPLP